MIEGLNEAFIVPTEGTLKPCDCGNGKHANLTLETRARDDSEGTVFWMSQGCATCIVDHLKSDLKRIGYHA